MIPEAPWIETDRLVLRGYRKDDFRPNHAIVGDDSVMRFVGGTGIDAEDCWRRLTASVGSWPLLGFGGWAVTLKSDGRLIGTASLFNAWREMEPEFGEDPEMGWIFASEVHGQGIAGEACRAVLDWADRNLQPTPVWAIVAPANEASLRLAERLGFEGHSETLYKGEPTVVLRRPPRSSSSSSSSS